MLLSNRIILRVQDISKSYKGHTALDGISFSVREGDSFGLVGESGAGKSTLARVLMRLTEPDRGHLWFRDTDLTGLSQRELLPLRRNFQFVFQDPDAALNPQQTVRTSLLRAYAAGGLNKRAAEEKIVASLETLGIERYALDRYPRQLSGGQKQRVVIARALSTDPSLLIADEPTAALDASVQIQVLNLFRRLQERGVTVLCISHDLRVVGYLCSHIGVLRHGRLLEIGTREQILKNPRDPYTQELVACLK